VSLLVPLLSTLHLATLGVPQDTPEVATWKLSKESPLAIAQMTDKKINALRRVECETEVRFAMPLRKGNGGSTLQSQIQNPKQFLIQFLAISFTKRSEIDNVQIKADGKLSRWDASTLKKPRIAPVGTVQISKNAKPADWVLNHPRYLYGATIGETPFADLVRRVQAPGSGYQVKLEQRTQRRLNVPRTQYRLSVKRLDSAAKKLGPLRLEAIIDAKLGLPVLIGSEANQKGQETVAVVNNIRWKVRRQSFDAKLFSLAAEKTKPKAPVKKKA
jgi:hypothetical protein